MSLVDREEHDGTLVNVASLFDAILADAAAGGRRFGITNTTGTCLTFVGGVPITCATRTRSCSGSHPSDARVHELLADFVVRAIGRRHGND